MEDEAAISDGPHIIRRRAPDAMERGGRGRVGYQRPRASVIVDDGARVPDGPELARPIAPHGLERVGERELSVSGPATRRSERSPRVRSRWPPAAPRG